MNTERFTTIVAIIQVANRAADDAFWRVVPSRRPPGAIAHIVRLYHAKNALSHYCYTQGMRAADLEAHRLWLKLGSVCAVHGHLSSDSMSVENALPIIIEAGAALAEFVSHGETLGLTSPALGV